MVLKWNFQNSLDFCIEALQMNYAGRINLPYLLGAKGQHLTFAGRSKICSRVSQPWHS